MSERELAFLNSNEYLRENIDTFIEIFVGFYGEEFRDNIETKFKNAIFMGYQDLEKTESFISRLEQEYTNYYLDDELIKAGVWGAREKFFKERSFEYRNSSCIEKFRRFYDLYLLGYEGRRSKFIEDGWHNFQKISSKCSWEEYRGYLERGIIPEELLFGKASYLCSNALFYVNMNNVDYEFNEAREQFYDAASDLSDREKERFIGSSKFEEYKRAFVAYTKALRRYGKLEEKLTPYKEYVTKSRKLQGKLKKKYLKKLVGECSFIYNDRELQEINEYFDKDTNTVMPNCLKIFGVSLDTSSLLESFTKETQDKLDDPNVSTFDKSLLIDKRIRYFKARGIDLGNNYEEYVRSEKARGIWPTFDWALKVEKTREKMLEQFNNEFYTSISRHREFRREITELGLLDKSDSIDASLYTSRLTAVMPNIIREKNELKLFPIVAVNVDPDNEYLDHTIIHELNHLYELSLLGQKGTEIEYLCGWDYVSGRLEGDDPVIDNVSSEEPKRKYEIFNEIINELVAQDISKEMVDRGICIFNNHKYTGYTSYEHAKFLVKDFYQEFKPWIMESRRDGNIEVIFDKVGRDNFDCLNELVGGFSKIFSGYNYYKLREDLDHKVDNDRTRLYYGMIENKDKVLENMRSHGNGKKK